MHYVMSNFIISHTWLERLLRQLTGSSTPYRAQPMSKDVFLIRRFFTDTKNVLRRVDELCM